MKRIQNVTFWRDPQLPGVETARVCRSRHVFPKHAHDGVYAIGLMEKGGSYCLEPGDEKTLVTTGQIALINPGQVHSGVPAGDRSISYRMLYVDRDLMHDAACEVGQCEGVVPEFGPMVVDNPGLHRRLVGVCRIVAAHGTRLEKESLLWEALSELVADYGDIRCPVHADGCRRSVRRARALLSEDLDNKLSLADVARSVGLSRYHLLRVFKRAAGISPHVYRTQCRIDRARRLLRANMPISQVALETGFTDQSHFTNKFRQFTGATPGQYTAAHA
jgi:AraC-like DNA-binding protein